MSREGPKSNHQTDDSEDEAVIPLEASPSSCRVPGSAAVTDFTSLFVFVRLVETGSFSRTAQDLVTSTATVSKRLTRLEENLKVHLVHRTTRQFALTEAGVLFYDRAREILRALENAELSVRALSGVPGGTLRISAPVCFGTMHIGPLLPEFMASHPSLNVDLTLEDRFVDLVAEGYDVAIRQGRGAESNMLTRRRLARQRRVVCGSPAYFAQHGTPETPFDLNLDAHVLLRFGSLPRWAFRVDGEIITIETGKTFVSNNENVLPCAALRGTGLVCVPHFLVHEHLQRGDLVEVLAAYEAHEVMIDALSAPTPYSAAKVRTFLDFLGERVRERLGGR